jgi:translation initiation factor 2 beta subunit (eIF-2beta)/eIF-5
LFKFSPPVFNKKLQNIAKQIFGDKISEGGEYYKNITLYDFRHSGAIHFRQLFQKTGQSLDSLRHRGGWVDFDMINYYTKLLGLDGHIAKEKLLLDEDRTKIEKELDELKLKYNQLFNIMKKLDSLAEQKNTSRLK